MSRLTVLITFGAGALWVSGETQLAAAQDSNNDQEVEEIIVTGRAQTFYRIDSSTTATKTPTDFLSIPQSVQILSRQLMDDQAATKITDLYRSVSGVNEFSYSGFTLRGFRQEDEIKYDGISGDPFAGFSVPQIFNIERIEVLKGPSSMLYGVAEPGGLINYVTKKPTHTVESTVGVFVGNYDHYGVSGEWAGPLDERDTVRLRLGGYNQQKKPWRYGSNERNTIIDGGVDFDLGSRTTLLVQGIHMDQLMNGQRFRTIPSDENGNFLADRAWNAAEPTDIQALEATVYQARLQRTSDTGLNTTVTARYSDSTFINKYHEPRRHVDTDGDGAVDAELRQYRDQIRLYETKSLTVDNYINMDLAGKDNLVLFGADYARITANLDNRATPNFPVSEALSFANPIYGNVDFVTINAQIAAAGANGATIASEDLDRYGLFLQDQITLNDRFEAVLGLRYDSFDADEHIAALNADNQFKDNNLTARGGLIFHPLENVSTYFSYSEGFLPQTARNQEATNGPFDPLISESYEVGIKGDLFGGSVQASAAAYQITKKNLLQPDPDPNAPPGSFLSLGKVQSEGIEFDFIGDLSENWVLMFNYAYNDTRIKEGVEGSNFSGGGFGVPSGGKFINAPQNTVGVWTRYEFPSIHSSIAGGLDYVDDRVNYDFNPVPAYTIYDLSWQTDWRDLNFQINVKNLFDKEYAVSGFLRGNFPGEPRTIVFQVTADLGER